MKMKLVLAGLLILLLNTGSSCINDGFLLSVNLPISHTWKINGGSNTNFTGSTQAIFLADQIDESYRDNIKGARYYDIRVSTGGTYSGNVAGTAYINGTPLLSFNGSWADFRTPQSLLGTSPHVTPQAAGVAVLVHALNSFSSNASTQVTLSADGKMSQAPVPDGLTLTVEVLAQADAQINK
jgi:hypothetical protein